MIEGDEGNSDERRWMLLHGQTNVLLVELRCDIVSLRNAWKYFLVPSSWEVDTTASVLQRNMLLGRGEAR